MALITDRIDIALTTDNALVFVDGDITFSSGVDGVVQDARIALGMIRGEWFADLDEGMPYFERDGVDQAVALLGQKFSEGRIRAAVTEVLRSVPSITEVLSLAITFDRATREVTITWKARTEFGNTPEDSLSLGV